MRLAGHGQEHRQADPLRGVVVVSRGPATGVVYLLHFDQPYKHARHYTGWAADLDARLAKHDAGRGARLLAVVKDAGIGWTLARTWPGTRARERAIKNQGGASRHCPSCGITPRHREETKMTDHDMEAGQ